MSLHTIPYGDAGTYATLNYMVSLASQGAVTPGIRDVAASLVSGTGRDPWLHCRLVSDWLEQHVEFLPDPSVAEALVPPVVAMAVIQQRGVFQGDCDCVAMLGAALGLSIGLRARYVVVAFQPDGPFAHVYVELAPPDGQAWLTLDPTRPSVELPMITRYFVREV